MNLSETELRAILQRPAIAKRNPSSAARVCAAQPKPAKGNALERPVPGEAEGSVGIVERIERPRCRRITFVVYAVRPCDYDGYHIKELQDLLVKAGCLDGDEWDILQGEIIPKKVFKKDHERTEVFIEPAWPFIYGSKPIEANALMQ